MRFRITRVSNYLATLAAVAMLAGCGSGGGSSASAPASSETATAVAGTAAATAAPADTASQSPAPSPAAAVQKVAHLNWDAYTNADGTPFADLGGYKVYYGKEPGSYSNVISVAGNSADITIAEAGTYYFAVTALDAAGNESERSGEVSQTVS